MKDQIEKQAIEEMAKLQDNLIKRSCTEFNLRTSLLLTEAANAIGTLLVSYRKQEWISVEERLPEESGRYLVNVNISHLAFEHLTTVAIMAYEKGYGFFVCNENEKVTHWMPLPEAPEMKDGAE